MFNFYFDNPLGLCTHLRTFFLWLGTVGSNLYLSTLTFLAIYLRYHNEKRLLTMNPTWRDLFLCFLGLDKILTLVT